MSQRKWITGRESQEWVRSFCIKESRDELVSPSCTTRERLWSGRMSESWLSEEFATLPTGVVPVANLKSCLWIYFLHTTFSRRVMTGKYCIYPVGDDRWGLRLVVKWWLVNTEICQEKVSNQFYTNTWCSIKYLFWQHLIRMQCTDLLNLNSRVLNFSDKYEVKNQISFYC